ncbi:MAG: rRNA maturation RNase YbeY [Armatimonadetes bacterium]|nr:rRNA maturation RNase YbeY [Armatimonadota bacterium]
MKIDLINLQATDLDGRFVQRVARRAALDAGTRAGTVSVALVDDAHIVELNRAHRRRNRPTDVLAYEGDDQKARYLGDVVISVETAARQALEADRSVLHEVAWLAAHGVLHLLGYDDVTAADRAAMIERQDRALAACLRPRGRRDR